jgi:hypothetical protein
VSSLYPDGLHPEIVVHEAGEPEVVVDLLDADRLTSEDQAEVDLVVLEADAPAGGDGDGLVVEGVVELGQVKAQICWKSAVGMTVPSR